MPSNYKKGNYLGGGLVVKTCLTLCPIVDCKPLASYAYGISQARILGVAICRSRGSSQPRDWTCVSCIAGRFFLIERSGKPNTKLNNLIVCISCTVLCARIAAHGWFCNSVSLHWNSACFCLTFLPSHEHLSFTTKATSLPKFAYNKLQGRSVTRDNDKERITVLSCADFCWQSSGERIKWDGMLGTQVLGLMMLFHSGFPPRFLLWASFRSDVQSAFGCEMEICAGRCLS